VSGGDRLSLWEHPANQMQHPKFGRRRWKQALTTRQRPLAI
jgi:hypothetical protein